MKFTLLGIALLGVAVLAAAVQDQPQPPRDEQRPQDEMQKGALSEIRVMLLDAEGRAVDLSNVTAKIAITPEGGEEKTLDLEMVSPVGGGNGNGQEPMEPEKQDPNQEDPNKQDPNKQPQDQPKLESKHKLICGEVKEMALYHVELIVTPAGMIDPGIQPNDKAPKSDEKDEKKEQDKPAPDDPNRDPNQEPRHEPNRDPGKQEQEKQEQENMLPGRGLTHDHGPYFRIGLDKVVTDKNAPLSFDADITFNIRGDEKTVSGFSYPQGVYDQVIGRLIKDDLAGIERDLGADNWTTVKTFGERVKLALHSLPKLAFEDEEDRTAFDQAWTECKTVAGELNSAISSQDKNAVQTAVDKAEDCFDKLDDAADEAQGAVISGEKKQ